MKTKVLIPVDRGRNSLTAEEHAIKLNWRMPLAVTLLNVINTKRLEGHGISSEDQKKVREAMRHTAQRVLDEAAEPFKKAELEFDTRVEEGDPSELICRVASEGSYDMVFIAESGLGWLEKMVTGSVVNEVLQGCKCPVLFLKHSKEQLRRQRRMRAEAELLPV